MSNTVKAPTAAEFAERNDFSLNESAALLNCTAVRVFQLVDDGLLKARYETSETGRRSKIRLPRTQVLKATKILRPVNGEPRALAFSDPAKRGPGRPRKVEQATV